MGIHIHAGTFGLFQQLFHVLQVVSADEDARVIADAQVHLRDLRVSVARGVGLVEQRHYLHTIFARFQHECRQFIHGKGIVGDGHQCFLYKCIDALLFIFQVVCMLRIGSHSLQSVGDQFTQRTDVFVLAGQHTHLEGLFSHFILGLTAPESSLIGDTFHAASGGDQALFGGIPHLVCHQDAGDEPVPVEIGIGDRHEQAVGNKPVDLGNLNPQCSQAYRIVGYPFAEKQQQVLHVGHIGRFSADTLYRAALVSTGFLTLITKHFFHI